MRGEGEEKTPNRPLNKGVVAAKQPLGDLLLDLHPTCLYRLPTRDLTYAYASSF